MTKVPIGSVMGWPAAVAPTLWHLIDGATLSRTTYADLLQFAIDNSLLGTVFGVGDGSTTFTLPNVTGRVLCAPESGFSLGATRGAATKTLAEAELPAHRHKQNIWGPNDYVAAKYAPGAGGTSFWHYLYDTENGTSVGDVVTGSIGSGTSFSILNPQYGMNMIMFIGPDVIEDNPTIEESNALIANAIEYLAGILSYLLGNPG